MFTQAELEFIYNARQGSFFRVERPGWLEISYLSNSQSLLSCPMVYGQGIQVELGYIPLIYVNNVKGGPY